MPAEIMKFAEKAHSSIRAWWRRGNDTQYDLINPYSSATEAYRQIGEYYPQLVDIPPLKVGGETCNINIGNAGDIQLVLPNGDIHYYWTDGPSSLSEKYQGNFKVTVGGEIVPVDMRAIVRPPVPEDDEWISFGVVSPQYTLLTPADAVELYDKYISTSVETIGALQRGKLFFISTQLPEIYVKDDHINRFMLVACPLDGISAAEVLLTDVRVVCANTYRAALNSSKERFVVQHHSKVKEHFGAWMSFLFDMVTEKASILQEVYDVLANHQVTSQEINWIANTVYKTPDKPVEADYPKEIYDLQYRSWERSVDLAKSQQETFKMLFDGGAIGSDSEAFRGTAYGAFQSVVQMENQGGQMRGIDGRMNQILFGQRNVRMQKAYAVVTELVKG